MNSEFFGSSKRWNIFIYIIFYGTDQVPENDTRESHVRYDNGLYKWAYLEK